MKTKTVAAVEHLKEQLKRDKEYREVWEANLAISFFEAYSTYKIRNNKKHMTIEDIHNISTKGAQRFLNLFCDEIKYPKGR